MLAAGLQRVAKIPRREQSSEVLRINPKFSLEVHRQRMPIKDPAILERHIARCGRRGSNEGLCRPTVEGGRDGLLRRADQVVTLLRQRGRLTYQALTIFSSTKQRGGAQAGPQGARVPSMKGARCCVERRSDSKETGKREIGDGAKSSSLRR